MLTTPNFRLADRAAWYGDLEDVLTAIYREPRSPADFPDVSWDSCFEARYEPVAAAARVCPDAGHPNFEYLRRCETILHLKKATVG